jgi:hypothetical protein
MRYLKLFENFDESNSMVKLGELANLFGFEKDTNLEDDDIAKFLIELSNNMNIKIKNKK